MKSSPTRKGRPPAVYFPLRGDPIPGLMKLKDGRWRASGPEKHTWSETDEGLAIQQFHEWKTRKTGKRLSIPVAAAQAKDGKAVGEAIQKIKSLSPPKTARAASKVPLPSQFFPTERSDGNPVVLKLTEDGLMEFIRDPTDSATFYSWLRRLIIGDPKAFAANIGLNINFDIPQPSPKLADLADVYGSKPGLSGEEVARVKRLWEEFVAATAASTIREIDHAAVERYEKHIGTLQLAPKTIRHRYSRVRTVLAYAKRRGRGQEDCRAALDALLLLEAPEATPVDPNPIQPAEFWSVYRAARKVDDTMFAALMLFALNACQYGSEVGAVLWDEVDLKKGEFVSRRNKTGVRRVACLWPETVATLRTLPHNRPTVFNTDRMQYKRASVFREWDTYRKIAGLTVVFSQIRDASYTIAATDSVDAARMLAGHRFSGSTDAYLQRGPQFVVDACARIRDEFAVAKHAK